MHRGRNIRDGPRCSPLRPARWRGCSSLQREAGVAGSRRFKGPAHERLHASVFVTGVERTPAHHASTVPRSSPGARVCVHSSCVRPRSSTSRRSTLHPEFAGGPWRKHEQASCSLSRAHPSPQHGQVNSASHCFQRRLVPWTRKDHTLDVTATMPGDNRSRSSTRTAAFAAPGRPGASRYRTQGLPQLCSRDRSEAGVPRGAASSDASLGWHPPTGQDRPDRTWTSVIASGGESAPSSALRVPVSFRPRSCRRPRGCGRHRRDRCGGRCVRRSSRAGLE